METKLCKSCRYYRSSHVAAMADYCVHPAYAKPADLVRGENTLAYCDHLRRNDDLCGIAAKTFERIPVQEVA